MIVLGIDPGSVKMGYAVLKVTIDSDTELVAHGLYKLKKGTIEDRCAELYIVTGGILASFDVDAVAVEEIPFMGVHKNYTSALTLATARGAILGSCAGYPTQGVTVSTWKSQTVGSSKADKSRVQEYIKQYFGLPKALSQDESDAAAIALVRAMEMKRQGVVT